MTEYASSLACLSEEIQRNHFTCCLSFFEQEAYDRSEAAKLEQVGYDFDSCCIRAITLLAITTHAWHLFRPRIAARVLNGANCSVILRQSV